MTDVTKYLDNVYCGNNAKIIKTRRINATTVNRKILLKFYEECPFMATPIPKISSLFTKQEKPHEVTVIDNNVSKFSKSNGKDLVLGTISGWLSGMWVVRIGKVAAFGLGGSVLLLHFAAELGYIHVNWDRIRESAGQFQQCAERALSFVRRNSCFSVGFVGGVCFGVASA
ncbi:unnamed protein product [Leptidea sinapis]|uniref:FUN14 domain-containing protein 1 n=1 Tax=Leptidea sinapis TaxID=189913 RepID=A0A5E4QT13_9NEOP|nr:unnamed protein product [Leptidea sinapis]